MKEVTRQARAERLVGVGQLGLPMQAAPIDRTSTGVALATGAGVDASFLGALAPFIPTAISALSKLF